MKQYKIITYKEAVEVVNEVGILPLSSLIPDFPSLDTITLKENWHTGTELDPWLWRAQFPVDGVAAYGKFMKKKAVLISLEMLPLAKAVLGSERTIKQRYEDGLISGEALELFSIIREEEGIDTRVLRAKSGMKEKEKKKPFDQALQELQSSMDIVISGTKEKQNELGEKNGWSSTSYETIHNWARNHNTVIAGIDMDEAKERLKKHLSNKCSSESMKAFAKIFML
ncbi:MAG: AlkZ-related protein [Heyndrickxia sp.]